MLNLNQKVLLNIQVRIASLTMQNEALHELKSIRQKITKAVTTKEKKLEALKSLKSSILTQELQIGAS